MLCNLLFYLDACKKVSVFGVYAIATTISCIFMCKVSQVSQKWSQTYKDGAGNKKKVILTNMSSLFPWIPIYHIFFDLANWQSKESMAKVSNFCHNLLKILVAFICLMINIALKNNINLENWKKLSTWLYLTYFKENKIIPLVSQKRSHIFGEKMFSIILTIFSTGG